MGGRRGGDGWSGGRRQARGRREHPVGPRWRKGLPVRARGGFCITDGDGVQARPWQEGRFAPVGGGREVQLQSEEAETGGLPFLLLLLQQD